MKLHDLQPAEGSHKARTRVGRGIAAGKGKTAGRGTKGQKARAGGSIPPWFEGGQTPLHMRIPKLRGFKNRFKIEYEVVNVGAIDALAERGAFETDADDREGAARPRPVTVNQDILRAVGLVRTLNKPLKILGAGELSVPLFVVADAFTASARAKIEAAGGTVNVLEVPTTPLAGPRPRRPRRDADGRRARRGRSRPAGRRPRRRQPEATAEAQPRPRARPAAEAAAAEPIEAADDPPRPRRRRDRRPRHRRADADEPTAADEADRRPATTPDPCSNRC